MCLDENVTYLHFISQKINKQNQESDADRKMVEHANWTDRKKGEREDYIATVDCPLELCRMCVCVYIDKYMQTYMCVCVYIHVCDIYMVMETSKPLKDNPFSK